MIDLMERTDTIKIDAGLRERWLTALRSEEYAGHETWASLATHNGQNFCALGLLAHVEGMEVRASLPVYGWLEFEVGLPVSRLWMQFDSNRMTFAQFADWLEAHSEPVQ